jgi:hypothetical protein
MSDEDDDTYMIDLDITIQWVGPELPDEDQVLAPIKRFIKKIVKTYSARAKLLIVKTNIYEVGFEEEESFKDN